MEGAGGPGTLTEIPMAPCCTETRGQEVVASERVLPRREASQAQVGAELRRRLFFCSTPPPPHACPAPAASPALAGKELTSRLLSVNVELLIPTARADTGVGGSREQAAEGGELRAEDGARARTPRARTFLGAGVGAVPASRGPHPPWSLRSRSSVLEATHATHPRREEQTFSGKPPLLPSGQGGADVWTDR